MKNLLWGLVLALPLAAAAQSDIIVLRPSAKAPAEVVEAIKAHVEAKKWVFMGAHTVKPKQGEVTLVKLCIPQVGAALWPVGLHVSALLPCGNIGVYAKQGGTEVAMLHPRYMHLLMPNAEVDSAVALATPQLLEMLDAVTR